MQIYREGGYSERNAARCILEHNLYGLDSDDRAYQLSYFAVLMKARQYDRMILKKHIQPHVYSNQESNSVNRNQLKYFGADMSATLRNNARKQLIGLSARDDRACNKGHHCKGKAGYRLCERR